MRDACDEAAPYRIGCLRKYRFGRPLECCQGGGAVDHDHVGRQSDKFRCISAQARDAARAASGHAAVALPMSVMNSRRFMCGPQIARPERYHTSWGAGALGGRAQSPVSEQNCSL
jgi:hypothetical protein